MHHKHLSPLSAPHLGQAGSLDLGNPKAKRVRGLDDYITRAAGMAAQRRKVTGAAGKSTSFCWEEKMAGNTDRAPGRIVVGVDGTTASAAAVRWAVREAVLRQANVHLVFADDYDLRIRAPYAGWRDEPWPDEDHPAATALDAAEQQARQALPPARLSSERAGGSPSRVLIDRSAGAELLVLGSAYQPGRSANDAWPPMGPVARDCLHGAACPVVVIASYEGARTPDT